MNRLFGTGARNSRLLRGLFGQPKAEAAEVRLLRRRLEAALKVLRDSQIGQSGKGLAGLLTLGSKRLYQLPWYVLIGAPGSGKTTALTRSGLRFALADQPGRHPMPAMGGTRDCDWWFSDEAVLLDTSGRYTTQDSEAWLGLLDLLRRHRPRQPLNGVLLAVSSTDLLDLPGTADQAQALRARLQELYSRLDMRLPVYVLVTQSDLIAGFDEFFATLDQTAREQVWGCTLPLDSTNPQALGPLLDALRQRLQDQLPTRLQSEPDLGRRGAIAGFDQQFAAACRPLQTWLAQVFERSRYDHELMLRGVYFTSGTQQGRPIDRLSSLGGAFGFERTILPASSGSRGYFLTRLLRELVFPEQHLGRRRLAWQRQRELARVGLLGALGLASVALLGGWAVSYTRNSQHVTRVDQAVAAAQPMVARLGNTPAPELGALLPVLETVTTVSSTPERALGEQPAGMGLGLFQGDKLDSAAERADRALLRDWLLPLIASRIEQQLRALDGSDPEFAYEALKAYRMLHDPAHFDAAALKAWILLDWERRPAGPDRARRPAFERQLNRLFDSGPLPPLAQDAALVERQRALLLRFSLPQRIYSRLQREGVGKELPGFSIERAAGPTAALVFVRRSGQPLGDAMAGLYTREGYRQGFAREVDRISRQLAAEASWVLGDTGSTPAQADVVAAQVRQLYLTDYARHWEALLADLALRPPGSLEQSVQIARILSGPESPLPRLVSAIVHETTLAQEPKGIAEQAGEQLAGAREQLGRLFGSPSPAVARAADEVPERLVDERFAALRQLVAGDANGDVKSAPINAVLKLFDELHVQLSATETAIRDKLPPPPDDAGARIKAESTRLPDPLRSLLQQLSAASTAQTLSATRQNLSAAVGSQVGRFCSLATAGRYPFERGSPRDVTREDFARLFAPGGLIDGFFQQLAPHVDTSSRPWSFRKTQPSFGTGQLAQFERAATIREVFFRTPSLRFDFKLLEADPGLAPLTLDIDGQSLQFDPGPAGPQSAQWPGPRGGLTAQLKLGNAGVLATEGPWALFRLVDRARTEPLGAPEKLRATFEAGGRRASFEITASSVQNPLRLRELAEFRCPQGL